MGDLIWEVEHPVGRTIQISGLFEEKIISGITLLRFQD
jgi:hypothetical protein